MYVLRKKHTRNSGTNVIFFLTNHVYESRSQITVTNQVHKPRLRIRLTSVARESPVLTNNVYKSHSRIAFRNHAHIIEFCLYVTQGHRAYQVISTFYKLKGVFAGNTVTMKTYYSKKRIISFLTMAISLIPRFIIN